MLATCPRSIRPAEDTVVASASVWRMQVFEGFDAVPGYHRYTPRYGKAGLLLARCVGAVVHGRWRSAVRSGGDPLGAWPQHAATAPDTAASASIRATLTQTRRQVTGSRRTCEVLDGSDRARFPYSADACESQGHRMR